MMNLTDHPDPVWDVAMLRAEKRMLEHEKELDKAEMKQGEAAVEILTVADEPSDLQEAGFTESLAGG